MSNNLKYIGIGIIAAIIIFFAGRFTKECDTIAIPGTVDTLKVIESEFIPTPYAVKEKINVDSISAYWADFWADSLGDMYGRGSFVVTTRKDDKYGSREYKFSSRIPLDPEASFIVSESLNLPTIYPKSKVGIFAGIENRFDKNIYLFGGLKYYLIDTKHFQLYAKGRVNYLTNEKKYDGSISLQTELRF